MGKVKWGTIIHYLSPIMRVLDGSIEGCLFLTMSNINMLGFPNTIGFLPAQVSTAATIEPVPLKNMINTDHQKNNKIRTFIVI